jgi:hypothetical protein
MKAFFAAPTEVPLPIQLMRKEDAVLSIPEIVASDSFPGSQIISPFLSLRRASGSAR